MPPARTHCFVLLDTGWVLSIDATTGALTSVERLEAQRGFEFGAFFGEARCRLLVVTKTRESLFFDLEPRAPPRLAQRADVDARAR
jgi:hypothetical protein